MWAPHNHSGRVIASRSRTDGILMVEVQVNRTIKASPSVFSGRLADPANLTAAPLILRAGWAKNTIRRSCAA